MVKLRDLQLVEFSVLKEFDRVYKKNDIKYSLAFGTLLGAVRHKGFIPWDDDIDVMMEYTEYLKFQEVADKSLNEEFYFQSRLKNPYNYIYWNRIGLKNTTSIDISFASVPANWGICIDIFPAFPINKKMEKKEMHWLRMFSLLSLKYFHSATFKGSSFKDKIKKLPHILMPKKLNQLLTKYYLNKFEKIVDVDYYLDYCEYPRIIKYNKDIFDKYTKIEFEKTKLMCIEKYDEVLTTCYGDYMKPPKNKGKHSDNENVIIDFNKPYQEYYSRRKNEKRS